MATANQTILGLKLSYRSQMNYTLCFSCCFHNVAVRSHCCPAMAFAISIHVASIWPLICLDRKELKTAFPLGLILHVYDRLQFQHVCQLIDQIYESVLALGRQVEE